MKTTLKSLAIVQCVVTGLALSPTYADDKPIDVGKGEYESACATCHGLNGKGDGPAARQLNIKIPDLTALGRTNQGVFPFDRVYQIIDGRQEVRGHGSREMPVWGQAFRRQTSAYFYSVPYDDESAARSRILALVEYVHRLQGK